MNNNLKKAKLDAQDTRIARRFKKKLRQRLEILSFTVFGSRARGDASPESDMDVFIEVPVLTPDIRTAISEAAWEVSLDSGVVVSTIVTTPDEIRDGPMGANPLLISIEREGVPV